MTDEAPSFAPEKAPNRSRDLDYLPLWLIVAGLIGLIVFYLGDSAAFPSASLDMKLSRSEIEHSAAIWSKKLGYDSTNALTSTIFTWDATAKTFLEFEFGSAKANELMKSEIPVWYWRTRFCRELEKEESKIYLSPAGKLILLARELNNDHALPSLTESQAEQLSKNFIEHDAGISMKEYALTNEEQERFPVRTDHIFSWEKTMPELHGAKMRLLARVSGNVVSQFRYYLYVPESWQQRFMTIRSYNSLLDRIASVFYLLLSLTSFFLFFRSVATHTVRWRFVLIAGAVIAVGFALAGLNNMNSMFDEYQTSDSLNQYYTKYFMALAIGSMGTFLMAVAYAAAGESFYRKNYPNRLALESFFKLKGLFSRQASITLCAGICGFGMAVGWVVLYYLLGEKVGFWCPLGITNYEIMSTAFPFYSAICLGVQAALSEEFLYRLIGLTLAQKLVRNFWLANLLQAAAWGFMHSNYPQQPAYARGIELTCSGLVFGWLMKRYGFVSCVVAHYLLDAFLDSQTSWNSSIPSLQFQAVLPVVPMIFGAALSLWRSKLRTRDSEKPYLNENVVVEIPQQHLETRALEPLPFTYERLGTKLRMMILGAIMIALPLGTYFRTAPAIGDGYKLAINRTEAIKIAHRIMEEHHVLPKDTLLDQNPVVRFINQIFIKPENPLDDFITTAWVDSDLPYIQPAMQYAFEKEGLKRVLEIVDRTAAGFIWHVKYCKPGDPTEYEVDLDARGAELSFDVNEPEDAPGAHLSKKEARAIVEKYIDYTSPKLKPRQFDDVSEVQQPARTDYTFTFSVPSLRVGDATYKLRTNVIGDIASEVSEQWNLPDQWKFEQSKSSPRVDIARIVKNISVAVIIFATFWWMIGVLRTGAVRWRSAALFAVPVALLTLIIELNDIPTALQQYSTNTPLITFISVQLLNVLKGIITKFAEVLIMCAFAVASSHILFPDLRITEFGKIAFWPRKEQAAVHKNIWVDAVLAAFGFVVLDWLVDTIAFYIQAHWSPTVPTKVLSNVCLIANVQSVTVDNVVNALARGIREVLQIGIVAGVYAKYCFANWVFFAVLAVQNVIQVSDNKYWQDVVVDAVSGITTSYMYWFFVVKIARKNILSYALAGFTALLFRRIPSLLGAAMPHFIGDVFLTILLMLMPVFYVISISLVRRGESLSDSGPDN